MLPGMSWDVHNEKRDMAQLMPAILSRRIGFLADETDMLKLHQANPLQVEQLARQCCLKLWPSAATAQAPKMNPYL